MINIGDTFTLTRNGAVDTFRREPNNYDGFACEIVQITHLTHSMLPQMRQYTFGAEAEWFRQRGLTPPADCEVAQ